VTNSNLVWRKAEICTGTATCVEAAPLPDGGGAMRDSKDPEGSPEVFFDPTTWRRFMGMAKAGELDE
jgi:hypothetical protein